MLFVNPLFLALGLGALTVPVVIHLMRRKQARVVPFSTLRFLMAVDQRLARRNKLRELLLLFVRLAALALLALALAQPSLESLSLPGLVGPRARILVVDDSASTPCSSISCRLVAARAYTSGACESVPCGRSISGLEICRKLHGRPLARTRASALLSTS